MDVSKIIENNVNYQILKELFDTQMSVLKINAYIIRRQNLDAGNFFNEMFDENSEQIPIEINIARLQDDTINVDKDNLIMTEEHEAYADGSVEIYRTDLILWDNKYYKVVGLYKQRFNGKIVYQKFRLVYSHPA